MTVFSDTYDTSTPAGGNSPTEADDRMREIKAGIQERENVDHYWPLTGTEVSDVDTGEHRKILFHAPIAATPTVAADHGDLRIKDVSGKAELHWTDEDENEIQLTDAGTVNLTSPAILGVLANDTYFTAVDNAGTGTIDLIKAGTNDLPTLPDSAEMASSAAPVEDEAIANKKYVDDNTTMVPAITGPGTGYAGEESVTFQNGLIMKTGVITSGSASGTVTFAVAFPTAAKTIQLTGFDNAQTAGNLVFTSVTNANFGWGKASGLNGFHWTVTGY